MARDGMRKVIPITSRVLKRSEASTGRYHLSGTMNWEPPMWDVLLFQAWLEQERQDL
jgi:hypothetical protein